MNFFKKIPVFLAGLIYPCKIHGKNNIPKEGDASVMVSNHYSALDCLFLVKSYPKDISFLAKKELFNNKILGKILKWYGAISIDRNNPEIKSLLTATKALKEGKKLVIFPEGTRNKTNADLQPLKSGSAIFAVKAKCAILPVIISGKARPFRRTHIIIGAPFTLDEFYDVKLTPEIIGEMDEIIKSKLLEQKRILDGILMKKVEQNEADNG